MQGFETARLSVRPLCNEDFALYCACYTNPELMLHIGQPLSLDATLRSFNAALKSNAALPIRRYTWTMQERISLSKIGLLALVCDGVPPQPINAEIGSIIAIQHQNRGFAAEAITALTGLAFERTTLSTLTTRHISQNGAAKGLMEKLGFQCEVMPLADSASFHWTLHRTEWQKRNPMSF